MRPGVWISTLATLCILLLSSEIVHGLAISSYDVSLALMEQELHEQITIRFLNTESFPLEHFSYVFDGEIRNLLVYDETGPLDSEVRKERDGRTSISSRFRKPLAPGDSYALTLEFDTSGYVTAYPDFSEFSIVLRLPRNTDSFSMKLRLPEGALLPRPLKEPLRTSDVIPLPDNTYSDGKSVIFEWRRSDIKEFSAYVKYLPEGGGPRNYGKILLAILALAALLLAFYLWKKRAVEKIEYLKEDEQLIIRSIMNEDGIDQKKIQQLTNFSKAKVSKIISDLDSRNIVRKEKFGRRNKLYLTKEFKKS